MKAILPESAPAAATGRHSFLWLLLFAVATPLGVALAVSFLGVLAPREASACGTFFTPAPTPVPTPDPRCEPKDCPKCTGSPCYVAGGNYVTEALDLQLQTAGFPIVVARAYDSARAIDGLLGYGWKASIATRLYYAAYLFQAPDVYRKEADIIMPDGAIYRFVENTDGTFTPPEGRKDVLVKNADGTFDLTLQRSRSRYRFSDTGALLSMTDDYGNALNVTYDVNGRVDRISDAAGSGRYIEVSYGANGRIDVIRDSAGRQVQYGYNPQGALTSVTDPAGRITSYAYENVRFAPLLTRITDHWGRVTNEVSYFAASGKVRTYTNQGETYTLAYNYQSAANRTAKTDSANNRWVYTYNPVGTISDVGLEGSASSHTDYYPDGSVQQHIDEVGVRTFYTYTAIGNPLTVTRDHLGSSPVRFDYAYDPNFLEKVISIIPKNPATGLRDPDWQAWEFDYYQTGSPAPGALHHVYRIRSDGTRETIATYVYNTRGQVTRHTSATGGVTDYEYDPAGNLTRVTGPANNDAGTRPITNYVPDSLGRIESATDPLGKVTSYTYDNLNRVLTMTLPPVGALTFTTTYIHDTEFDAANGILFVKTTDPNGNEIRQGFDRVGRLVKTRDALGNETLYTYTRDMLSSIRDANGSVTGYGYDALRRLRSTIFPNGAIESYDYLADGLLRLKTDRKNQTITYNYDRHKRLQSKVYPAGGGSIIYGYTGQKLMTVTDTSVSPSETHTFEYDPSYHVQSETQATRGTISYIYNLDDSAASYTVTGGPTATYAYYPDGSLNTIQWTPVAGEFKYRYTLRGQYQSITSPNGQTRNYSYDDQGRLTQLSNLHPTPGNLATYAYGYDLNHASGAFDRKGQRVTMTATVPSQGFDNHQIRYEYDNLYQLTKATYPNVAPFNGEVHSWTYDAIGNRLTNRVGDVTQTYMYQTIPPSTANWQRLLSDGAGNNTYEYDANGNTRTRNGPGGNFTFGWDYDDRTKETSGATSATYWYDYRGRRASKTVGGVTPTYLYNRLDPVKEGGPSPADYLFGPGIDEPLAMSRGGTVYYYDVDALGSVSLINDTDGVVQNGYAYDAWGVTRSQTGSLANPFTYTAREQGEAGALFYRARYYQPSVGRFLSEDPVGYEGGEMNLFSYVANDPTSHTDPSGLFRRGPLPCNATEVEKCRRDALAMRRLYRSCEAYEYDLDCIIGVLVIRTSFCTFGGCLSCPPAPPPEIHRVPPSRPHWPCPGDHWHYFEYHQDPRTCQCFLKRKFGGCL